MRRRGLSTERLVMIHRYCRPERTWEQALRWTRARYEAERLDSDTVTHGT